MGSQSIGASALATVLSVNILVWFPLGLIGLISLQSKDSQFESISSLVLSLLYGPILTSIHDYYKKQNQPTNQQTNITLTIQTSVRKVMPLFLNMLSRFVIAFLPRSKSLNFMTAVTFHSDFEAQENKCHFFHFFLFYLP